MKAKTEFYISEVGWECTIFSISPVCYTDTSMGVILRLRVNNSSWSTPVYFHSKKAAIDEMGYECTKISKEETFLELI